ncbi:MAG: hypothetical protein JJU26_12845 [Oceanicaulis sp.]|nr:hypothetical protein [Oceanicaulis sp.]
MDPKVEKDLVEALEDLETKISNLQEVSALTGTLKALETDVTAGLKFLGEAAKPFPDSLKALSRASDLLAEVSALIKHSDPEVISDRLDKLSKSSDKINEQIEKESLLMNQAQQDTITRISSLIQSASDRIGSINEEIARRLSELDERQDKMAVMSESLLSYQKQTKVYSILAAGSSLVIGLVIVVILFTKA